MLERLTPAIRGVILDMDGVLWKDTEALVDLPDFFCRLKERGLGITLATNNATRSPANVLEKLRSFGVELEAWQIVTSSMAISYLLKQRFPQGGPVYVVGEIGLTSTLEESGFYHSEDNPLAVVAGLDRTLTYDKLRRATLLIRAGVPYYGTNPDATFPTPEGLIPGAGTVLSAIETASGVQPIIAGKPETAMFEFALRLLDLEPAQVVAIGDRLDTDILGGFRAGCRTALVLSGVTTPADLENWQPKPDLIAARVDDLIK